jgi:ABC-type polysaccharide/polyol phosphate export permease
MHSRGTSFYRRERREREEFLKGAALCVQQMFMVYKGAMFASLNNLYKYRVLVRTLVSRELKARYRGSFLGFFWSFFNPLLLLTVYTIVFNYILPNRGVETQPYGVFLFTGLLPWTWFSSSLLEASNVIIAGGNLIKKIIFPAEVLPFVSVLANMVHFLLGTPILFLFILIYKVPLNANVLFFPLIIFVQLVLTLGFALWIASLSVHFRDLRDILANLLTLWFFCSPIIYPFNLSTFQNSKEVPTFFKYVLAFNPVSYLMDSYHQAIFYGRMPNLRHLFIVFSLSIIIFLSGYFVFDRLRDTFAEEV